MNPEDAAWREAVSLACRLHAGQVRRDGKTPYVAHVIRVALNVRHAFGCDDPTALTAALLHDAIEDTTSDYDEVAQAAGKQVADLVVALSKNMLLPEAQREADYDDRLARADWRARLIKLADVLDNLIDRADLGPEARGRMLDRCERALALSEHDTGDCFTAARQQLIAAMTDAKA